MSDLNTNYFEGRLPPGVQECYDCRDAIEALRMERFVQWVEDNPEDEYAIIFADGACARITPDSELWRQMAIVAKNYDVEVLPILGTEYVPWTGGEESPSGFVAITIKARK